MIKQKLRIGNIVRYPFDNKLQDVIVSNINITGEISALLSNGHLHVLLENDIKGTPLSPNWLSDFGLKHSKIENSVIFYSKVGTVYSVKSKGKNYTIGIKPKHSSCFYVAWTIQYVHELQNIHFAVTCEELSIRSLNNK